MSNLTPAAISVLKSLGLGEVATQQAEISKKYHPSDDEIKVDPSPVKRRRKRSKSSKVVEVEKPTIDTKKAEEIAIEVEYVARHANIETAITLSEIKWGEHFLTSEQEHALNLSKNGKWLKVEAYAGSGKTTLLNIISTLALSDKKVLYIAFNKAIVEEASREFPNNVTCKTTHSLAAASKVAWRNKRKGDGRFAKARLGNPNGNYLVQRFGLRKGVEPLTDVGLANYAMEIVTRFCNTDAREISLKHSFSDIFEKIEDEKLHKPLKQAGVELAKKLWKQMSDTENDILITHDVYLKVWALGKPDLSFYDVILFDEAQDANPLILDVVASQTKTQNIFVGDRYQQIYSWRGAINAMSTIETDGYAEISQSFRFGSEIADLASKVLSFAYDKKISVKGFDKIPSRVCSVASPTAVITRTNALLINELLSVVDGYSNRKVAIEGGIQPLLALLRGARDLKRGKRTSQAELATFENWKQVEEFAETPMGGSLKTLVTLARDGVDDLIDSLEECNSVTDTKKADIVFTTAHKSKGKEYRSVRLGSDFRRIKEGECSEEANLLYVALTRATHELDISDCEPIDRILNPQDYDD